MPNNKPLRRLPLAKEVKPYKHHTKIIDPAARTEDEREAAAREFPESEVHWKPKTRAECAEIERPCIYVSCIHNLYLDVVEGTGGNIRLNFPDLEGPEEMTHSCALDLAEEYEGGMTCEEVAEALNISRERVRQIEAQALAKLWRNAQTAKVVRDMLED